MVQLLCAPVLKSLSYRFSSLINFGINGNLMGCEILHKPWSDPLSVDSILKTRVSTVIQGNYGSVETTA